MIINNMATGKAASIHSEKNTSLPIAPAIKDAASKFAPDPVKNEEAPILFWNKFCNSTFLPKLFLFLLVPP